MIGCGGTIAQLYPLQYLLDRYGKSFVTTVYNGAELANRRPAYLGPNSLMVASSHSGGTRETVEAVRAAREQGAKVIAITGNGSSALAEAADICLTYQDGPALSEAKLMLGYLIGIQVLAASDQVVDHEGLLAAWRALPDAFWLTMEQLAERAQEYANSVRDERLFYVLGAGGAYGAAYAFCICKLMEMQWRHGVPLNAAEFFHGPVEVTEGELAFLVLMSEDNLRPTAERAVRFLAKYSLRCMSLTPEQLSYLRFQLRRGGVHRAAQPAINIYAEKLSETTGHPLSRRRYRELSTSSLEVLHGVGDNVVDKYVNQRKTYPGKRSQCGCLCRRLGLSTGYVGVIGTDRFGQHIKEVLAQKALTFPTEGTEGPNRYAEVELIEGDRKFVGRDFGAYFPFSLDEEDFSYLSKAKVIHTSIYSGVEEQLPRLAETLSSISFDFSNRWEAAYLAHVLPFVTYAFLSASGRGETELAEVKELAKDHLVEVLVITNGSRER